MNLTQTVKDHKETASLFIAVLILLNSIILIGFYGIDPHSQPKCEYFYGHSGSQFAGADYTWNRSLNCGLPQKDKVFWHNIPNFYEVLASRYFYAFLMLLASLGVYYLCLKLGYDWLTSLSAAFLYGISAHFWEFLPLWSYGWRFTVMLLPWQFYLIVKLKTGGNLLDIALLAVLSYMFFVLYETEIAIYYLLISFVYVLYNFIDSIDTREGLINFGRFFWKFLVACLLTVMAITPTYLPLFKSYSGSLTNLITTYSPWRISVVIILITSLFILIKTDKKKLAIHLMLLLIIIADVYVLINYLPDIGEYRQCSLADFKENNITEYLEADTTQYRIFPIGKEFQGNRWAYRFESIGGNDRYKNLRYQEAIKQCLSTEIDKNLNINWQFLGLLNVKYLISRLKVPSKRLEYASFSYEDQLILYKLKDHSPYAWFAEEWKLTDQYNVFNTLNNPRFLPEKTACIESIIPEFSDETQFPVPVNSQISYQIITPEQIKITTENDSAGFLVISELYEDNSDWQVYIDEVRTRIHPVNFILRGIVVPPGSHQIEMRYEPEYRAIYKRIGYAAGILILILILAQIVYYLFTKLI